MRILLLVLLACLHSIDSCSPTPSVPMPNPPTCSATCAMGLLTVPTTFAADTPSMSGPCAVRTLLCVASVGPTATITYNGVGTVMSTSSVTLAVTCNAAGTAWTYMGVPITSVACS